MYCHMAPVEDRGDWAAYGLAIWAKREKVSITQRTNLPYGLGGALASLNTPLYWDISTKE